MTNSEEKKSANRASRHTPLAEPKMIEKGMISKNLVRTNPPRHHEVSNSSEILYNTTVIRIKRLTAVVSATHGTLLSDQVLSEEQNLTPHSEE